MLESLLYALAGLAFLNGVMYLQQPGMIFFPYRTLGATPKTWGLEYEDVTIMASDGVSLHGWYIPHAGARRTLLFLHGNAGNISHRGDSVVIFHRLGLNVLLFDYRGYGQSEGRPSEAGLFRDATAAWRFLTEAKGFRDRDIVIFGRSLGGAVAARLAAEVDAEGVILESTFSSARDFARMVFPVLARLVWLRYDFDAGAHLRRVRSPVLVLHSRDDEIMPFALGERLFQAGNEPKRLVELHGDHNGGFLLSQPDYERSLAEFIGSLDAGAGGHRTE